MRLGAALFALLAAAGIACVGQGTGQVQGEIHVHPCDGRHDLDNAAYTMDPDFFVGEPIEDTNQDGYPQNRLEIRVQASSGNLGGVGTSLDNGAGIDTLFISIRDVREVALAIGQPITLRPIDVNYNSPNPPPVRAALQMLGTCPFSTSSFLPADTDMTGPSTITFTRFGNAQAGVAPPPDFKVDFGEEIEASFDLNLVDERYKLGLVGMPEAWGHVTGNLSFELRRGAAGQTFP